MLRVASFLSEALLSSVTDRDWAMQMKRIEAVIDAGRFFNVKAALKPLGIDMTILEVRQVTKEEQSRIYRVESKTDELRKQMLLLYVSDSVVNKACKEILKAIPTDGMIVVSEISKVVWRDGQSDETSSSARGSLSTLSSKTIQMPKRRLK